MTIAAVPIQTVALGGAAALDAKRSADSQTEVNLPMAKKMGRYCKAYPITRLREFPGWTENSENARKETKTVEESEVETPRQLAEGDFLYLQEDFTVTDGIFLEENVIFDNVSPEWIEFCKTTLKFEVPVYEDAAGSGAQ